MSALGDTRADYVEALAESDHRSAVCAGCGAVLLMADVIDHRCG